MDLRIFCNQFPGDVYKRQVVTSAHAKSMGGSQVFLEEGEVQTVETLIKCIVIASGNDASVSYTHLPTAGAIWISVPWNGTVSSPTRTNGNLK